MGSIDERETAAALYCLADMRHVDRNLIQGSLSVLLKKRVRVTHPTCIISLVLLTLPRGASARSRSFVMFSF